MANETRVAAGISCHNVRKSFGSEEVLRGVSLAVPPGESLAVMGRSGSGKSTLLRGLALLEQLDAGDATLNGTQYLKAGLPCVHPPSLRRRIAIVFQQFNLFPHLTVLDNCILGPIQALRIDKDQARVGALRLLEILEMGHALLRYPESLSGGEAQRIAIARALLMQPEVLLLDEVTSFLDPESTRAVLRAIQTIRGIAEGQDTTIIVVTHFLEFAETFASEIAFISEGRIVDLHPASDFRREASSGATLEFLSGERVVRGGK